MLVRYVCEFCGNVYKNKKRAVACEGKALKLKPRLKVNDIVCDASFPQETFRVLKVLRWRPHFDRVLKAMVEYRYENLSIPRFEHTFVYVLLALENGNKKRDFTREDIFSYNRLKHGISFGTKGIMLQDEEFLERIPS